jgi:hypothetical protein
MVDRPTTDEDLYVREAIRQYDVVADRLEKLVHRMRELGVRVANPNSKTTAVSKSAEAVSEFTNGVGNISSHLWGLITNAQDLDEYRTHTKGQA